MNEMRIVLCCGAGMSSGFLSQKTRVAAKKAGILISIEARSDSNVTEIIKDADILLLGPHLSGKLKLMQELCDPYNIPVLVIPHNIYGALDGEGLLNLCIETLKK